VLPTIYMKIKLNNTLARKVGVFIPGHFQPAGASRASARPTQSHSAKPELNTI
jgi:hypothetical protein